PRRGSMPTPSSRFSGRDRHSRRRTRSPAESPGRRPRGSVQAMICQGIHRGRIPCFEGRILSSSSSPFFQESGKTTRKGKADRGAFRRCGNLRRPRKRIFIIRKNFLNILDAITNRTRIFLNLSLVVFPYLIILF